MSNRQSNQTHLSQLPLVERPILTRARYLKEIRRRAREDGRKAVEEARPMLNKAFGPKRRQRKAEKTAS